jgi:ferrochelatase
MAHGTPTSPEEIEPFYTRIRRGRPPSPEQLAELTARYGAIGGLSPLTERTIAQVDGLTSQLDAMAPGRYTVSYGAKHAEPTIEAATTGLAALGPSAMVGLVLTPHRSGRGTDEYLTRAERTVHGVEPGLRFVPIEQWFDAPGMAELWARRVSSALEGTDGPAVVVFSAHSVPETAEATADPYGAQVERTAELVAKSADLDATGVPWRVAWQSAGRTEQRWKGPDLLATIDALGSEGTRTVVVCPVGFVADHLEILYDLDIEAKARAESAGLSFRRTESFNADPDFLAVLAGVVARAAEAETTT